MITAHTLPCFTESANASSASGITLITLTWPGWPGHWDGMASRNSIIMPSDTLRPPFSAPSMCLTTWTNVLPNCKPAHVEFLTGTSSHPSLFCRTSHGWLSSLDHLSLSRQPSCPGLPCLCWGPYWSHPFQSNFDNLATNLLVCLPKMAYLHSTHQVRDSLTNLTHNLVETSMLWPLLTRILVQYWKICYNIFEMSNMLQNMHICRKICYQRRMWDASSSQHGMVSAIFQQKIFAVLLCICFYVRKKREEVPCAVVFVIIRFPHWKACKHYLLHQNKCKEPIVPVYVVYV